MTTSRVRHRHRSILIGLTALSMTFQACDQSESSSAPDAGASSATLDDSRPRSPESSAAPAGSDPSTASPSDVTPPQATLAFDNPTIDFGRLADFDKRQAAVTFLNAGTAPLRISKVEPTCGCTSVGFDTSRTYEPGETGEITLAFSPKGQGPQNKAVRVLSNDPDEPVRLITIKANVVPSLSAEPRVLQLGRIPLGERFTTGTTLTALRPGITLRSVTLGGDLEPHAEATITPAGTDDQGRDTWRVEIVLDDRIPWGWQTGSMVVDGIAATEDGNRPVSMNFAINGSAEGDLQATDTMLRLMVVEPGGSVNESIELRRADGEPFRCTTAAVEGQRMDGFSAELTPLDPDGRAWRVSLTGTAPTSPGSLIGSVLISTDVAGEEAIAIRIGGVVRR